MFLKRHLLALTFILSSLYSNAQPYQSIFGSQSTTWDFFYAWVWDKFPAHYIDSAYVRKDTVVNGMTYKLVTCITRPHAAVMLREDVQTGKVWYSYGNTESLMFDFSLQPGDTFNVSHIKHDGYPTTSTVDSVRVINGRRHIYFDMTLDVAPPGGGGSNWVPEQLTFIEGIGSNSGIFPQLQSPHMLGQYLVCSYKDGIQTSYVNRVYNGLCRPALDVPELLKKDKLQVYPVPATDAIHLQGLSITEVRLIALDGRILKKICGTSVNQVDIRDIPAGTYTLRLVTGDGQIMAKMVQVAH